MNLHMVEMDVARLRALTHSCLVLPFFQLIESRNGCSPFKGIDTC